MHHSIPPSGSESTQLLPLASPSAFGPVMTDAFWRTLTELRTSAPTSPVQGLGDVVRLPVHRCGCVASCWLATSAGSSCGLPREADSWVDRSRPPVRPRGWVVFFPAPFLIPK